MDPGSIFMTSYAELLGIPHAIHTLHTRLL